MGKVGIPSGLEHQDKESVPPSLALESSGLINLCKPVSLSVTWL